MNTTSPLTLASRNPAKKPYMLVVDDEPNNLDLLYRAFRKDFKVFKAESGAAALEVLETKGEMAVIISDQRMPLMKGTEFLSRTVATFPDTVRIILTGFTDVSDLVDAINASQVYRYVTKPWDADNLEHLVELALDTYTKAKAYREEAYRAEKFSKLVVAIGQLAAQSLERSEALTFLAEGIGQVLDADACALLLTDSSGAGCYGAAAVEAVKENGLVRAAIASGQIQSALKIQANDDQANDDLYAAGVESHLTIPIICRGEALAVLSIQWKIPYATLDDVAQLFRLIAPQLALSLKAVVL